MRSTFGAGVIAGLIAGLAFAIVMATTTTTMPGMDAMSGAQRVPSISMMARVVRSDSLVVGWIYVIVASAVFGGLFGWLLGERAGRLLPGVGWGLIYGLLLWVLGALIVMPTLLGMPALSPLSMPAMRSSALVSLGAHLLSGVILGAVFAGLYDRRRAASGH